MLIGLLVGALGACATDSADVGATRDGQLATCDSGPHCVSSVATDSDRRIAPLTYSGSRTLAQRCLVRVVQGMQGAKLVDQRPGYVHAIFTSAVFGFVDDVVFELPKDASRIEMSSSSRIGYYDFGVNRSRMKKIRKRFEAAH